MKPTPFAELERLTPPELTEKAAGLRKALFGLRLQQGQRSLAKTADVRVTRRDLARVLTALNRRQETKAS